jgi:hypothetical protein
MNTGTLTLSKLILLLILGSIFFSACRKDNFDQVYKAKAFCELQTGNPSGRSYAEDSLINFTCAQSHCGILPLNTKNYWVYEDSIFNDGVFQRVQMDTLRFSTNYRSIEDGLVWWKSNISIGLPDILYTNDTAFFGLNDRMYNPGIKDVKKDYSLFPGDSVKYLASFEDNAASGRSLKLDYTVITPAGNFDQCIYFEKNARNYRKDQVFFRPGLGVLKYIMEKAPMGSRIIKLQQVSTLVSYHIE